MKKFDGVHRIVLKDNEKLEMLAVRALSTVDSWGECCMYTCDSEYGKESFVLYSYIFLLRALRQFGYGPDRYRLGRNGVDLAVFVYADEESLEPMLPLEDFFGEPLKNCLIYLADYSLLRLTTLLRVTEFPLNINVRRSGNLGDGYVFAPRFDEHFIPASDESNIDETLLSQWEGIDYVKRLQICGDVNRLLEYDLPFSYKLITSKHSGIMERLRRLTKV